MRAGDSAAAGLLGIPWPSLAEAYELAGHTRRDLPAVVAPCLILHAQHDDIAHVRNARMTAARVSGPVDLRTFADSYHILTLDRERQRVIDLTVEFFRRHRTPRPRPLAIPRRSVAALALATSIEGEVS